MGASARSMGWRRGAATTMGARRRVVVIGAGPGGLAAALLLQRAGVDTVLLERSDGVGGRTRSFDAPGGYRFDYGPTFFLYPRVLAEIFAACGEDLNDHVDLRRIDPLYRLVFEGGETMSVACDRQRLMAEIARLAPSDAANLERYLADNAKKLEAFRPILERPFPSILTFLAPHVLKALPLLRPFSTVDRDLARCFADPRIRLAFSFQSKYLGMSPYRCPSLFTILSFLEHGHGIWHPMGGCGSVSEAMARLARRMGVDIRLGQPAERILFDDKRATGVVVDGRELEADAVVVNADFDGAIRQLVPERFRRQWPDRKLDKARLSCSTFMLYLGIEGSLPEVAHHSILLAEDYRRNIAELDSCILPMAPSLYVQNASITDPSLAPPGHSALYVLVPVPNLRADTDWAVVAPHYRDLAIRRLELLGIRDLASRIRYERVLTPLEWRDGFAVGRGATFNLAHDLMQMLCFRPQNRFAPGVYLVGGGTHPGSGLPVIYEGARITSRLLLRDLGVAEPASMRVGGFATAAGPASLAEVA